MLAHQPEVARAIKLTENARPFMCPALNVQMSERRQPVKWFLTCGLFVQALVRISNAKMRACDTNNGGTIAVTM